MESASSYGVHGAELKKAQGDALRAGIMAEMDGGIARNYSSRVAKIAAICLNEAMTNKPSWQVRAYAINLRGHCGNTMEATDLSWEYGAKVLGP